MNVNEARLSKIKPFDRCRTTYVSYAVVISNISLKFKIQSRFLSIVDFNWWQ